MLQIYKDAWLTSQPVVLGVQLRPLTIGHAYLLEAFDSAFFCESRIDLGELVFAAWVCSRSFEDCLTQLRKPEKVSRACRKWGRKARRMSFVEERDVFLAYLETCVQAPKRWDKGGSYQSRVPWQFSLVWALSGGRVDTATQSHLWNMPIALAFAYYAARQTAGGDDSYISEDELAIINSAPESEAEAG